MEKKGTIFYLIAGRFPGEKAAALFAAKSTEAFQRLGQRSEVLAPRRLRRAQTSVQEFYRLKEPISTVYFPTIDLGPTPFFGPLAFRISLLLFGVAVYFYLFFSKKRGDICISNEAVPLLFASFAVRTTCYEVHDYPEKNRWLYTWLFSRVTKILVTNRVKLERLRKEYPAYFNKFFYEANAVDLDEFEYVDKEKARQKLALPSNRKLAVYTGQLFSWKGTDTLASAAKLLPEDWDVYVVGGSPQDVAEFKQKHGEHKSIHTVGQRPYEEMPLWQSAADVLVLPNTAKEAISRDYTSPMKLFMYMASGVPIVATDLPSVIDVVGKDMATIVPPDDPKALASGIQRALTEGRDGKVARAKAWVSHHTWERRGERILAELTF